MLQGRRRVPRWYLGLFLNRSLALFFAGNVRLFELLIVVAIRLSALRKSRAARHAQTQEKDHAKRFHQRLFLSGDLLVHGLVRPDKLTRLNQFIHDLINLQFAESAMLVKPGERDRPVGA